MTTLAFYLLGLSCLAALALAAWLDAQLHKARRETHEWRTLACQVVLADTDAAVDAAFVELTRMIHLGGGTR